MDVVFKWECCLFDSNQEIFSSWALLTFVPSEYLRTTHRFSRMLDFRRLREEMKFLNS